MRVLLEEKGVINVADCACLEYLLDAQEPLVILQNNVSLVDGIMFKSLIDIGWFGVFLRLFSGEIFVILRFRSISCFAFVNIELFDKFQSFSRWLRAASHGENELEKTILVHVDGG